VAMTGRGDPVATMRLAAACAKLAARDAGDPWISAALLSGPPEVVGNVVFPAMARDLIQAKLAGPFVAKLIEIRAASKPAEGFGSLIDFVSQPGTSAAWLRALGDGLRRAGTAIEQTDAGAEIAGGLPAHAPTAAR